MSDLLPPFNADGLLPVGDYHLTLTELRRSILVTGPRSQHAHSNWDSNWRLWLVDQLALMAEQLWLVGLDEIFLNGSFVEDKDHPNDIDGYFVCDRDDFVSGQLQKALNVLDPQKVLTWDPKSRLPYRGYPKKQLPITTAQ
jgi:hypothetical protein